MKNEEVISTQLWCNISNKSKRKTPYTNQIFRKKKERNNGFKFNVLVLLKNKNYDKWYFNRKF